MPTTKIRTSDALACADEDHVHYAEVKLVQENPHEQIAGRIVAKWQESVTLRYRGHDHEVVDVTEWQLVRFQPATGAEKQMIAQEWDE